MIRCCQKSIVILSLACLNSAVFAEGISQVAIFNETKSELNLTCQFDRGMQERGSGKKSPVTYHLKAFGDVAIELLGEPLDKGYWLNCFATGPADGSSFFAYDSKRKYVVNGHFHFDPVYDGAFTYED